MERKVIIAVAAVVLIAAVFFFVLASLSGGGQKPPKPVTNKTYNITNPEQKDEHGCLISEGYSWCDAKSKCLKAWEESCEPERFGQRLGAEANLAWGNPSRILAVTPDGKASMLGDEGWLRDSFYVPEEATYSNLCYIFFEGNLTQELGSGTVFHDYGPVNVSGREVCSMIAKYGLVEPCGNFTVYIDLKAMKAGYDMTADNWRDFFSCQTQVDSAYCKSECDAMLQVLMKDERRPASA